MEYDLVFEGGGAKGMVFAGAIEEFLQRGNTYGRLLGTSAGAINATLLAVEYDVDEMAAALTEREDGESVFVGFMGEPAPFDAATIRKSATRKFLRDADLTLIPNLVEEQVDNQLADLMMNQSRFRNFFSFVERGGWYSAHKFRDWLTSKLDSGEFRGKPRAFSKMTLKEFHAATRRDVTLVASDVYGANLLVLNHRTAPDCPVVWAVRMSMSIPLLWQEVIWQPEWGKYRGRKIAGHAVVDGGMLSNFPIELFVSDQPDVTAVMGPKQGNPVLGLLIDDALPVPQPTPSAAFGPFGGEDGVKLGDLNTTQRVMRLINTMTTAHDKMVIEAFRHLVVHLPAGGYGTVEFDMSDARREALVEAGRVAMTDYLDDPGAAGLPMPSSAAMPAAEADRAVAAANRYASSLLAE